VLALFALSASICVEAAKTSLGATREPSVSQPQKKIHVSLTLLMSGHEALAGNAYIEIAIWF
jgi:hypothetical protein